MSDGFEADPPAQDFGFKADPYGFEPEPPDVGRAVVAAGETYLADKKVSPVLRWLRGFWAQQDVNDELFNEPEWWKVPHSEIRKRYEARETELSAPKPTLYTRSPLADETGPFRPSVLMDAAGRSLQRQRIAHKRTMGLLLSGKAAEQNATDIAAMEAQLGAEPDYNQSAVEQVALDAIDIGASSLPSMAAKLGVQGLGAAIGGLLGGRSGVAAGYKMAAPLGTAAAALASFDQEVGNALPEMLALKLDDGTTVDPDVAKGAALLYGVLSAGVEVAELAPRFARFGPLGEAIRRGEGLGVAKQLLREQGARGLLGEVFKTAAKNTATETAEELLQEALSILTGEGARAVSAGGKVQKFDAEAARERLAETGIKTATGIAAGTGAVGALTHAASIRLEQRAAAKAQAVAGAAGGPVAAALPAQLAAAIKDATAADGVEVTHLHVDPVRVEQAAAALGIDPAAILGPEAAERLAGAKATRVDADGHRTSLEIPVAEFLAFPEPLALELADHVAVRPGHRTTAELATAPDADEATRQAQVEATVAEQDASRSAEPSPAAAPAEPVSIEKSRAMYRSLTDDAQREMFHRDTVAGTMNDRAFWRLPADPARPMVAFIEGEGGKWANIESHAEGDRLIKAYAQALHDVDPEVARGHAGFMLQVRDQAHADAIIEQARQKLPEALRGFELRAVVEQRQGTPEEITRRAGRVATAQKSEAEKTGKRAPRGTKPHGSAVERASELNLPPSRLASRIPDALTASHDAMTEEERFRAIHLEPETGLYTGAGFKALPENGAVAAFDLDGLKVRNDIDGDEAGDLMLQAFAGVIEALGAAAVNGAHLHGDEYAAGKAGATPETLRAWVDEVRQQAESTDIILDHGDYVVVWKGIGFEAGIGDNHGRADEDLSALKAATEQRLAKERGLEPAAAKRASELSRRRVYRRDSAEGQAALDELGRRRDAGRGGRGATAAGGGPEAGAPGGAGVSPATPGAESSARRGAGEAGRGAEGLGGVEPKSLADLQKAWADLRHRAGATGDTPIELVKRAAATIVGRSSVRRLSPNAAANRERAALKVAALHSGAGKFVDAYRAVKGAVLARYEQAELRRAVEDREKFEGLLAQQAGVTRRETMGKAGTEYLAASDQLLEALGGKAPEPDTDRPDLARALHTLEGSENGVGFDVDRVRALAQAAAGDWKNLDVDGMRDMLRALAELYHAAREAVTIEVDGKRQAVSELVTTIAKEAAARPDLGTQDKPSWWAGFRAARLTPQVTLRKLGQTAYKVLWGGMLDAESREDALLTKIGDYFAKKWDALPKELQRARYDQVELTEPGMQWPDDVDRQPKLDRQFMWMVALNMGNASNRERLLGGYHWDPDAVLRWLDRNMTPAEWDFVESTWALLDKELWPQVAETYKAAKGVTPEKIEATPIKLSSGRTVSGGYFPARYDPVASRVGEQQSVVDIEKNYQQKAGAISVGKSFTKARARKFSDVVNLDWSVVPAHVLSVAHYIAFDPYVRRANALFRHRGFASIVRHRVGAKDWEHLAGPAGFLAAVSSAAADAVPATLQDAYSLLRLGKSILVTAAIGWSIKTTLGDFVDPLKRVFAAPHSRIAPQHLLGAMTRAYSVAGYPSMRREALDRSPHELRHRAKNTAHELRQTLDEVGEGGRRTKLGKALRAVQNTQSVFLEMSDKICSTIVWTAAYNQELSRGAGEKDAARKADDVVQASMPVQDAHRKASILRDKRGLAQILLFFSYQSQLTNDVHEALDPFLVAWGNAEGLGGKLRSVASSKAAWGAGGVLGIVGVAQLLGELVSGRGPEDDEEPEQWALRKMLASAFNRFPVVGELGEELVNRGVSYGFDGELSHRPLSARGAPGGAGFERLVNAAMKAIDSEDDDALTQVLETVEALSVPLRLPPGSAAWARMRSYATDGDLEADVAAGDAPAVAKGLVFGPEE